MYLAPHNEERQNQCPDLTALITVTETLFEKQVSYQKMARNRIMILP